MVKYPCGRKQWWRVPSLNDDFMSRGSLVGAIALFALSFASAARADTTFAVRFLVSQEDGAPVVDQAFLDAHLRRANELFAPAGVAFEADEPENRDGRADIVTRSHRHALAPEVSNGRIHVFVVRSLADVDVAGRVLRGVHWRSRRGGTRRHYVILSSIAREYVLAHELGHFFGNPHSPTPGNIMSYERADGPPFFDEGQLRRIRRFRRRFAEGELEVRES